MSTHIEALSQAEAESHAPSANEVCISIRCHGATVPSLREGWHDVLYIEADDAPFTSWETPERRAISPRDAVRVARFAIEHRERAILVHCFAGVSRSVSVAAAIRAGLGLPAGLERIVNPLTYNRVIEGFQRLVGEAPSTDSVQ